MKTTKTLLSIGALVLGMGSTFAQTNLKLNIAHHFDGQAFDYGTTYDLDGKAVSFERVQYYLSGFSITHDGGQTTDMPDSYVLGSGNMSSYDLGQENITSLEGIEFDLGVDNARNQMGTDQWPPEHPLSAQTPSMDWGWPAGYFFFTITGKIDDSGDGTPDTDFQLHGVGGSLRRDVDGFSGLSLSGSTIVVALDANVADWVRNLTLETVGIDHSASANNETVADNTNNETVFTLSGSLGNEILDLEQNDVYADYTMPYAPTIFYNLVTKDKVDITVYDMAGKVMLEAKDQQPEGNYFIRKELKTGTYFVVFVNGETEERLKFVVKQ